MHKPKTNSPGLSQMLDAHRCVGAYPIKMILCVIKVDILKVNLNQIAHDNLEKYFIVLIPDK